MIYWSSKNKLKPRDICKNSSNKFKFNCDKCSHEFESSLHHVNKGTRCPYCYGSSLCNIDDCSFCYNKSFASSPFMICWSPKNKLKPRNVRKNSNKKFKFNCDKCHHEFDSVLNDITNGHWCPKCKNKTELLFLNYIKTLYSNTIHQFKIDWCKNKETNRYFPFDFCIESKKVIIEIDGIQHFKQVLNWSSPELQKERDIFKIQQCIKNDFSVIRILQEDIFYNKCNWKELIKDELLRHPFSKPDLILLGNNQHLYSHFQN